MGNLLGGKKKGGGKTPPNFFFVLLKNPGGFLDFFKSKRKKRGLGQKKIFSTFLFLFEGYLGKTLYCFSFRVFGPWMKNY